MWDVSSAGCRRFHSTTPERRVMGPLAIPFSLAGLLLSWAACSASESPSPQASDCCLSENDWLVSVRHCPHKRSACEWCDLAVWQVRDDVMVPATRHQMLASLHPDAPICIMIHGSFVDWHAVCQESRMARSWIRRACPGWPVHILFFTWPSDETRKLLLPVDVAVLGKRASRHAQDLAYLIGQIPTEHPLCLVGHSHGARMALATLHLLGGGEIDGISLPAGPYQGHRLRAVLAAAAVDRDWLNPGELYERAILRAESILNLQNRHDAALSLYPLSRLGGTRALGRVGLSDKDRQRLGPWCVKLHEVDVTAWVGRRHLWSTYMQYPEIAGLMAPYVFFRDSHP